MTKLNNIGDVFPRRNLGDSESWGRHVEVRIEGAEGLISNLSEFLGNGNKSLTARAEGLSDQIRRLVSQQEMLEHQQNILGEQQEVLEVQQRTLESQHEQLQGQQEALESQQLQLISVVESIPVTTARTGSETEFVIQNGTTNYGTQLITVPEDKTKCSVFATGQSIFYSGNVPQASIASWRMRFMRSNPSETSTGVFGPVIPMNMDVKTSSFSHSADFTGLVPGSNIFIDAQSVAGQTHPSPYAENSVSFHAIVSFYN